MKTVVCVEPGTLAVRDALEPRPQSGEAVIRIRRIGVCGTDMHIFSGKHPYLAYPRVMGHELSGEVAHAPHGSSLKTGQVVAINPYIACGRCHACRQGKPNCCMSIEVLGVHRDGGMAEYIAAPESNVLPAEGLSLDDAAMVEFLAIGAHAVARSGMRAGQRALVVGAGPIGLGVALFARLNGAAVTCMDLRAERLRFCRDAIGVSGIVVADDEAEDRLKDITNGDGFDVVFDATGAAGSIERGFAYVAHGGVYVLVSVVKDRIGFSDPEFHKREMTLIGSRNALSEDFARVMDALRNGRTPADRMLTHRAPLVEAPAAIPAWINPDASVIKAMLTC